MFALFACGPLTAAQTSPLLFPKLPVCDISRRSRRLTLSHPVSPFQQRWCNCGVCHGFPDSLLPSADCLTLAAVGLYAFLGFLMDGPATLATSLIGLRISPHFDEPYRSHSIASFWGRRWNITASNALRFLVYDTICDGAA